MKKKSKPEFDEERMRQYISLSPEEKLKHLEELNAFLEAFTPKKSKRIWEQLKERGW